MSEPDCQQSSGSASRKRCPSPDQDESGPTPTKSTKVSGTSSEIPTTSRSCEAGNKETTGRASKTNEGDRACVKADQEHNKTASETSEKDTNRTDLRDGDKVRSSNLRESREEQLNTKKNLPSTSLEQSDKAAIAAAEALASLTGDGEDSQETPCSSEKAQRGGKERHVKLGIHDPSRENLKTQAAAADSSTSVHSVDREDVEEDIPDGDGSTPGSSSTPSSSFLSDNEDDEDDGECAIVSVKMAPEIRQSVSLLAQVQMRLEALEKKSARLHQRLEMKMTRQRRPHLDQRSTITQSIPGFWVTALLNHPHLSAHIDETDEDALSYMIDLEVESFKNDKLGYRIRFHFRRNPYFQNNIIMKELHLGMGGSPVSFSNSILWHRGQNLTVHSEPRKTPRGVYQTFFSWFGDHSNPGRDDIAQILKDDLYRDPLRYYLTPLWEPRENGSGSRAADNSNGDDCVVISDSDDEQELSDTGLGHSREDEEEQEDEKGPGEGSDDSDQRQGEDEDESFGERDEDVYVEEEESSRDAKAKEQEDEEDIQVYEDDESND